MLPYSNWTRFYELREQDGCFCKDQVKLIARELTVINEQVYDHTGNSANNLCISASIILQLPALSFYYVISDLLLKQNAHAMRESLDVELCKHKEKASNAEACEQD